MNTETHCQSSKFTTFYPQKATEAKPHIQNITLSPLQPTKTKPHFINRPPNFTRPYQ